MLIQHWSKFVIDLIISDRVYTCYNLSLPIKTIQLHTSFWELNLTDQKKSCNRAMSNVRIGVKFWTLMELEDWTFTKKKNVHCVCVYMALHYQVISR